MFYVLKKKSSVIKLKLLLVLGGDLALTCSYSERWQVYTCSSNRAVWPWCSVRWLKFIIVY